MADWLTLDQYKQKYRVGNDDTVDDAAIQQSIDAVDAKFRLILDVWQPTVSQPIAPSPDPFPADVTEAGLMYVNRLLSRRNSPDGVVGVSDVGTATILPQDSDIKRLLGSHLRTVLA